MSGHIVDDQQRGDRPATPMRPSGSGGARNAAPPNSRTGSQGGKHPSDSKKPAEGGFGEAQGPNPPLYKAKLLGTNSVAKTPITPKCFGNWLMTLSHIN
jgi:hypothetical protein